MKGVPLLVLVMFEFGFFISGSALVRNNLSCYQCLVEANYLCTEDQLKPCANDQAYDVCITIVRNTVKDGYHIQKKCGLGPCSLDRKGLELLDRCDSSQEEYECMSCCKSNGCNKSDGNIVKATLIFIITATFFVSIL